MLQHKSPYRRPRVDLRQPQPRKTKLCRCRKEPHDGLQVTSPSRSSSLAAKVGGPLVEAGSRCAMDVEMLIMSGLVCALGKISTRVRLDRETPCIHLQISLLKEPNTLPLRYSSQAISTYHMDYMLWMGPECLWSGMRPEIFMVSCLGLAYESRASDRHTLALGDVAFQMSCTCLKQEYRSVQINYHWTENYYITSRYVSELLRLM